MLAKLDQKIFNPLTTTTWVAVLTAACYSLWNHCVTALFISLQDQTFPFFLQKKSALISVLLANDVHSFSCPLFLLGGSRGLQPQEDSKYLTVQGSSTEIFIVNHCLNLCHSKTTKLKRVSILRSNEQWEMRAWKKVHNKYQAAKQSQNTMKNNIQLAVNSKDKIC